MSKLQESWADKYAPSTLESYIFQTPQERTDFEKMVETGSIPNHLLFTGVHGTGKAQPLTAKILTPTGWQKMGDLQIGDLVTTPSGKFAQILNIFPQGIKNIYSIEFHDGSSTECCDEHLWKCFFIDNTNSRSRKATEHLLTTQQIIEYKSKSDLNVSIPLTHPISYKNNWSPNIPPYLLGVLLGDGGLTQTTIKLTTADPEIIISCSELLIDGYQFNLIKSTTIEFRLINQNRKSLGGRQGMEPNFYTLQLKELGLWNKKSNKKFIPIKYLLETSIEDRFNLLQGLLDTDGTVGKQGDISFTSVSRQLANDVQQLVWSLGGVATITQKVPFYTYKGERKQGQTAFTVHIAHPTPKKLFRLKRKLDRCHEKFAENHAHGDIELKRRVKNISYKGKEEAQCILIDDPDHLYITDDFIVTHNTTLAKILINSLNVDPVDLLIIAASNENSVDTVRGKIVDTLSTYSVGEFKIILLDEVDFFSLSAQGALRNVMDEYKSVSRFILTCNYAHRVMPELKSRCNHYHFKAHDKTDIAEMVAKILIAEKVKFDLSLLDKYIDLEYPDVRKIINLTQQFSHEGRLFEPMIDIDAGAKLSILDYIEKGQWVELRKHLCETVAQEEWVDVYKFLYENLDKAPKFGKDQSKWEEGIVTIADYLYKHSIVADSEICMAACIIRLQQIIQEK
jgi:DNA polymerase III delta prime subunit